jgi:serine/threonine-protein kinase
VVSTGKPQVTVPDVTGMTQADAEDAIRRANLTPQVVPEDISPSCFETAGNVCRQDPAGGEQATEGSVVTIFVAREPGGGSPTPSDTTSPSPTPSF